MSEPVEFSRLVKVETLPRDGLTQKISANEVERANLSKRFALDSLQSLEADFVIKRSGKGVRVTGEARAKLMYICVVTVDPFPGEVVEEIDVRFAPPSDARRKPQTLEEEIRFDAEDEPDPLIDGAVDLGELAAEFIALGLDPYPRKPEAEFDAPAEEEKASPFAGLRLVKDDERESD